MKDQLEGLVSQMVEHGILFDEAVGEFEKRFIKRVSRSNRSRKRGLDAMWLCMTLTTTVSFRSITRAL